MNENNDSKFNPSNANEASKLLQEIVNLLRKYERVYQLLTPQERSAVGGVVFNLVSIWGDFSLVGHMATRPIAASLINQLLDSFNQPRQLPQDQPNLILPSDINKNIKD